VVLGFCRFEFGERGGKGFGIDHNLGILNLQLGRPVARVGLIDTFFQSLVFALA
jgi:hypothetical protein